MPPFFVLLLDPANTGGLARRCCTSILSLQRFEQNQSCLGGEETDKQVVGRKDWKRSCHSVEMVHEQDPT